MYCLRLKSVVQPPTLFSVHNSMPHLYIMSFIFGKYAQSAPKQIIQYMNANVNDDVIRSVCLARKITNFLQKKKLFLSCLLYSVSIVLYTQQISKFINLNIQSHQKMFITSLNLCNNFRMEYAFTHQQNCTEQMFIYPNYNIVTHDSNG